MTTIPTNEGIGCCACGCRCYLETGPCRAELVANALLVVLDEIAKGKGRFSIYHFAHAMNTIEDMKALAVAARIAAQGEDPLTILQSLGDADIDDPEPGGGGSIRT